MDGLPPDTFALRPGSLFSAPAQRTLKSAIGCVGVGLHTGRRVSLALSPAAPGAGIVFRRTDLGREIVARYDNVVDTRLSTVLGAAGDPELRVGTVEHLMAALAATGIDDAVVTLDGPEVPVLDGSSAPFLFLIDCAGTVAQAAPRRAVRVLRTIRVEDGDSFVELRPHASAADVGLDMTLSIAFDAAAIGRQALSLRLSEASFRRDLAFARTFALAGEIERLRQAGLARGGSLDNAVVVDGARVLNPSGLRRPDEFVRHKALDAIGDLFVLGAPILGRFEGELAGHGINNQLVRALAARPDAWRIRTFADEIAVAV